MMRTFKRWVPLLACPAVLIGAMLFVVGTPTFAKADDKWTDTRSVGPFICQATFPLAECEPILKELPELQRELTRTLGIPPTREPVGVYLFADAVEHQAYIEQHFPLVPYRRALFVKEGDCAGVYAYRHPELAIDIRHECTHALLHGVLNSLPLWLDEGLAEYFEVPPSQRAFDHPHYEALRWNMRLGMVRSIEALEERTELTQMNAFDYRYSWAWVHFMLHGPEAAHRTLVTYLAGLERPRPAAEAEHEIRQIAYVAKPTSATLRPISIRLSEAVPNPTEKMVQHFKHWR